VVVDQLAQRTTTLPQIQSLNQNSGKPTIAMYIRQSKLPNLKAYKYSAIDESLTSKYVLKPFYANVVIKCFPSWMA